MNVLFIVTDFEQVFVFMLDVLDEIRNLSS